MGFLRRSAKSPMSRADVVDAVAESPDGERVGLTMIETRAWDGGEDQLRELQAKLNVT